MSRPHPTTKVLRIAVLSDGRILTERLMASGAPVRIGSDSQNDLVLQDDAFGASTTLFMPGPDGYILETLPTMHGKVTVQTQPASLRQLIAQGTTSLNLTQDDRGKLVVGDTTVLFQFVAPPPVAAHLLPGSLDFRPRLFEEDDPIFMGATSVFTGLAAVMLAWVYTSPPPAVVDVIELDPRIGRIIMLPPSEPAEPVVDVDEAAEPVPAPQEPVEPLEVADAEDATPPADDVLPDGRELADLTDGERQELAVENTILIDIIGGLGEAASPAMAAMMGQDDEAMVDMDRHLGNVTGVRVADGSNDSLRAGQGTNSDDVDIGDLNQAVGGRAELQDDVTVQVTGSVMSPPNILEPDVEDPDAIKAAVDAGQGRLITCYDRALKTDPNLQGRVDIEFYISQGRVTQAQIFADTTHNSEFTSCLTGAIRRIRFPTTANGEVVFPFIFSPRG